jgi:hypothetical membrane protein
LPTDGNGVRVERALLGAGLLVPVLYYAALLGASLTWPGYSHARQYASELGSAAAPFPWLFNVTIMATGVAGMIAASGVFLALKRLGGRALPSFLAGLALFAWGLAVVMGGMFPMPNPLHNGFGLALAMHLVPPFTWWSLAGRPAPRLKKLLALVFVLSAVLILVMFDVGGLHLVRRANVGLWQRAYSLTVIPWIGVLAWMLRKETP